MATANIFLNGMHLGIGVFAVQSMIETSNSLKSPLVLMGVPFLLSNLIYALHMYFVFHPEPGRTKERTMALVFTNGIFAVIPQNQIILHLLRDRYTRFSTSDWSRGKWPYIFAFSEFIFLLIDDFTFWGLTFWNPNPRVLYYLNPVLMTVYWAYESVFQVALMRHFWASYQKLSTKREKRYVYLLAAGIIIQFALNTALIVCSATIAVKRKDVYHALKGMVFMIKFALITQFYGHMVRSIKPPSKKSSSLPSSSNVNVKGSGSERVENTLGGSTLGGRAISANSLYPSGDLMMPNRSASGNALL